MISVPFLLIHHQDCVHLDFKKNEVNIPYTSPYKVNGLFSKLTKKFSIRSDSDTKPSLYIISPKDGSEVTNTFFIEVIDFLIDNNQPLEELVATILQYDVFIYHRLIPDQLFEAIKGKVVLVNDEDDNWVLNSTHPMYSRFRTTISDKIVYQIKNSTT